MKVLDNVIPNRVHDHDNIRIFVLKNCDGKICRPLETIFKQCFDTGDFSPIKEKESNISFHENREKQVLKSFSSVLLFLICEGTLERLVFYKMFYFFLKTTQKAANKLSFILIMETFVSTTFSNYIIILVTGDTSLLLTVYKKTSANRLSYLGWVFLGLLTDQGAKSPSLESATHILKR